MVNIPDFSIDPERERCNMENQARQLIQDLNDFILGVEGAHITRLSVEMFQKSLAHYENSVKAPEGKTIAEGKLMEKLAEAILPIIREAVNG